ncbi:hypothetical protein [Vibrio alginolyticus]|uniref:hypothetical protein n=1 Tax=Vibrio alginolyticus TaxID=663 RepID=UPI002FEFF8B7
MYHYRVSFMIPLLIFIIFFGITLRSLYFQSLSLAPFPIISILSSLILLFISYDSKDSISKNVALFISMFLLFLSLSLFVTVFDMDRNVNINSIIGINLNIILFLTIYLKRDFFISNIKIINIVLFIHLLFFIIQLVSFHFFGEKLDFLEPITGESQRINGFSSIESSNFSMFRPAGLFNEPGNYSIHILTLMWILKINDKISPFFEKILVFSIVLSFSLSGIAAAIAYVVITFNYSKFSIRNFFLSSLIISFVMFNFYDLISLYLTERIGNIGSDNSANVRLSAFDAVFDFSQFHQLFGLGFANDKLDIHLPTIPYFLVTFGYIGTFIVVLLFFYFLYHFNVNAKTGWFFLVLSFQFYTIMHPLFWLFFALVVISFESKKENLSA